MKIKEATVPLSGGGDLATNIPTVIVIGTFAVIGWLGDRWVGTQSRLATLETQVQYISKGVDEIKETLDERYGERAE